MLVNFRAGQEPPVRLLQQFLRLLQVSVTGTAVRDTLLHHPDYPSLLSLSDALRSWKVNTAAVQVRKEELLHLPLPFIAYTRAGGVKTLYW